MILSTHIVSNVEAVATDLAVVVSRLHASCPLRLKNLSHEIKVNPGAHWPTTVKPVMIGSGSHTVGRCSGWRPQDFGERCLGRRPS